MCYSNSSIPVIRNLSERGERGRDPFISTGILEERPDGLLTDYKRESFDNLLFLVLTLPKRSYNDQKWTYLVDRED